MSGLRMILLGERESGRSAVGNAILGRGTFDSVGVRTRHSVKRQGVAAGRQVTVVDTPGWEWFSSHNTSLGVKSEIARSVSLCPPGPHTLLLVVPLSFKFRERERQALEEHMKLFGEGAWQHALVLFTVRPGRLKDSTIEEEIEESEALQGLVARCGNRFHVLPARPRKGQNPIAELLGKVEAMVANNKEEVILSEGVLEEARVREEVQARRDEEEARQREEELARVKKALQVLEMEEGTEDMDKEEEEEKFPGMKMRDATKNRVSVDGSENSQKRPTLICDPREFRLREMFNRSCWVQ